MVVVSIIGCDRFTTGYSAAKAAHERAALACLVPVRVLRAAQFHEFVPVLMAWGRQGNVCYVPKMRTQLVAARTVAEALADLTTRRRTGRRQTRAHRIPRSPGHARKAWSRSPSWPRAAVGEPTADRGREQPRRPRAPRGDRRAAARAARHPGPDLRRMAGLRRCRATRVTFGETAGGQTRTSERNPVMIFKDTVARRWPALASPALTPARGGRPRRVPGWAVLAVCCVAQFMVALDVTI